MLGPHYKHDVPSLGWYKQLLEEATNMTLSSGHFFDVHRTKAA